MTSINLPANCTLKVTGPAYVVVGEVGVPTNPVPDAVPQLVPQAVPTPTPFAVPQRIPQPMAVPPLAGYTVPPPMLHNNETPVLVPPKVEEAAAQAAAAVKAKYHHDLLLFKAKKAKLKGKASEADDYENKAKVIKTALDKWEAVKVKEGVDEGYLEEAVAEEESGGFFAWLKKALGL